MECKAKADEVVASGPSYSLRINSAISLARLPRATPSQRFADCHVPMGLAMTLLSFRTPLFTDEKKISFAEDIVTSITLTILPV
ncbi:MAG: hypothetical protein ABIJ15_05240 [bacterium]